MINHSTAFITAILKLALTDDAVQVRFTIKTLESCYGAVIQPGEMACPELRGGINADPSREPTHNIPG